MAKVLMRGGMAALLGAALASTKKKAKSAVREKLAPTKKKAKSSKSQSVLGAPLQKRMMRKSGPSAAQTFGTNIDRSYRTVAPTNVGLVTFRSARETIVRIPFSSLSPSYVDITALTSTVGFRATSTTTFTYFDLNPYTNTVGGFQQFPFGIGVSNIAKAYSRYRVSKLTVTYVPVVGTSTPGSLVLGATLENFLVGVPTAQLVADSGASCTTPVWQQATLDCTNYMSAQQEWLYTYVSGATVSEQRQDFCLSLIMAGIGCATAPAANTTLGYLRFDGIVEFTGLSDVIGGLQSAATDHEEKSQDHPSSEESKDNRDTHTEQVAEQLVHSREESETHCATPSSSLGIPPDKQGRWFLPSASPQAYPQFPPAKAGAK